MTEHTPGPWAISAGAFYIDGPDGLIAEVRNINDVHREANARLIAAAPGLLEALRDVVAIADRKTVEFDRARVAIAKAAGRAL